METKSCTTCIHFEVCSYVTPFMLPCDTYMEVIHCKDCVHFDKKWCVFNANIESENDFCSHGERRKT